MADEARILELVENALCLNLSAEEVCANCPELLADVRNCLEECRHVDHMVESMFPSTAPPPILGAQSQPGAPLPEIPGYEVLAVLGRGGHGTVYRARHLKLKRVAALKMLLTGEYASPAELARFTREAEAIAALQHPNIVQIYDVGEVDGRPYFAMEYVDGGSLTQKHAGVPQPGKYSAALIERLACAVHTAHLAGIVHRDVKPANVLLSADGTPKIADFGLARQFEGRADITHDAAMIGTPSYMAPEQVIGKPGTIGPSADIYSLGATLYELLTGRPPFRAESAAQTRLQVLSQDPAAPSKLNANVPRDLETICLKCLHKEPARRYESASALADDLRRFAEGRPIQARPAGRVERAWRWVRRNPAHAAAWVGSLVGLAAILGAVLWTLSERAAINRAVSDDLTEVVRFEEASDWRAARNTLERAKTRLGAAGGRDRLAQRASQVERELDLVDRLDEMRFGQRVSGQMELEHDKWWRQYREAFTEAGLLAKGDTPEAFAARVARAPARTALVAAMDDMSIGSANRADLDWILTAARLSDPDPWRDRARDTSTGSNLDALSAVAREARVEKQPVPLLLIVGGRLMNDRPDDAASLICAGHNLAAHWLLRQTPIVQRQQELPRRRKLTRGDNKPKTSESSRKWRGAARRLNGEN